MPVSVLRIWEDPASHPSGQLLDRIILLSRLNQDILQGQQRRITFNKQFLVRHQGAPAVPLWNFRDAGSRTFRNKGQVALQAMEHERAGRPDEHALGNPNRKGQQPCIRECSSRGMGNGARSVLPGIRVLYRRTEYRVYLLLFSLLFLFVILCLYPGVEFRPHGPLDHGGRNKGQIGRHLALDRVVYRPGPGPCSGMKRCLGIYEKQGGILYPHDFPPIATGSQ